MWLEARVGESGPRVAHEVAHEMGQSGPRVAHEVASEVDTEWTELTGPPLAHKELNVEKLVADPRKGRWPKSWRGWPSRRKMGLRRGSSAQRLDLFPWATFGRRRAEAVKRMEERASEKGWDGAAID